MASSIAAMTMPRSIDFSRATASAIWSSSSRLALTAMASLLRQARSRRAARLHHQGNLRVVAALDVVTEQPDAIALDARDLAAEPLPSLVRDRHVDLDEMTGIPFEIRAPHQRPVDSGRGNFQPVGAL